MENFVVFGHGKFLTYDIFVYFFIKQNILSKKLSDFFREMMGDKF